MSITLKLSVVAVTVGMAVAGLAEVAPGENILLNGMLEADQVDFPPFWTHSGKEVQWKPSDGPRPGTPFVRIASEAVLKKEASLRQYSARLAEGGRFRISAWVRTKNMACTGCGIVMVNSWWRKSAGVGKIPKDTGGKWVELSNEFTCFESDSGEYSLVAYASNMQGEFDVADIRVVAIDKLALEKTERSSVVSVQNSPRVLPMEPLLGKIPADDPTVTWKFLGKLPKGTAAKDFTVEVAVGGRKVTHALDTARSMRIRLPEGVSEYGVLSVGIVENATGKRAYEDSWRYRLVQMPKRASNGRRLNNLCTEYVNRELSGGEHVATIDIKRDGWFFAKVDDGTLEIDGREVIGKSTPRGEMFRHLEIGSHRFIATGKGRFVVRQIADIVNYCPGANSHVAENGKYDWDFQERFVLPAVTTQDGGSVDKAHLDDFLNRGYRWMQNLGRPATATQLVELIGKSLGMTHRAYGGVSCDEQYLSRPGEIDVYTRGLKMYDLKYPSDRPVCSWTVNKAVSAVVDDSYFATAVNVSGGNGMVWFEAYCRTRENERDAAAYIENYIGDTLAGYRKAYPLSIGSTCVALGNFNQVPILSLQHHPEVDYKYFLDMQAHYLATSEKTAGIGSVGYWGSYYADEELHRWSFALMRHYVVEGKTSMLSERYGFSYRPEHIQNGDFRETLAPWRVSGEVTLDSFDGFGTASQNRWGGNGGLGDTFAVLVRTAGKGARLGQEAKGLVPGKLYCLQFATFDADDVKAKRIAPRRFGIGVTFGEGMRKREDLSWVFVDRRIDGRYAQNNGCARINLHHIVFEATAETLRFAFDSDAAKVGERLGVNFVSLNPYFAR